MSAKVTKLAEVVRWANTAEEPAKEAFKKLIMDKQFF